MNLSSLKPAEGSIKSRKRIGRGQGSGRGGTSTRGHKGAKQRSGFKTKIGFEGGQMPIQRRIPKFGFKNVNKITYKAINLSDLQSLAESLKSNKLDVATIVKGGLATKNDRIKILGNGSISLKLEVSAHAFSQKAEEQIVEKGGSIVKI